MARELPPLAKEPERGTCRPLKLDYAIGEPKWRTAAMLLTSAQDHLQQLTGGSCTTDRVVSFCPFRQGSDELLEEYGHRSRHFRDRATETLMAPAPSPRELANKIKLLAYIEGLADPSAWDRERSVGWTKLEEALAQLWMDCMILDQFHDEADHARAVKGWEAKARRRKASR